MKINKNVNNLSSGSFLNKPAIIIVLHRTAHKIGISVQNISLIGDILLRAPGNSLPSLLVRRIWQFELGFLNCDLLIGRT